MKSVDYLIEVILSWQFLLGISFEKNYNGSQCHVIRIDLLMFRIILDISRKTDEWLRFINNL